MKYEIGDIVAFKNKTRKNVVITKVGKKSALDEQAYYGQTFRKRDKVMIDNGFIGETFLLENWIIETLGKYDLEKNKIIIDI